MARAVDLRFGVPSLATAWSQLVNDRGGLGDDATPMSSGGLFGQLTNGNVYLGQTKLTPAREAFYGTRVGVSHTYFNQGTMGSLVTQASSDLAAGRIPWCSVSLDTEAGWDWPSIAAGAKDVQFNAHFAALDAIGKGPILWCAQSEPNGNTGTGVSAANYKAMYRHLKALAAPYPQILLSPILAAGFSIMNGGFDMSDWMDPDTCHLPTVDTYNHISYVPANGLRDLHISEAFGLQVAQIQDIFGANAPWGVAEWGVRTDPSRPGYAAGWMQDAYDFIRQNNCYAFSYFDSGTNIGDRGSSWALDYTGDGTDGSERINQMQDMHALSTSKRIPIGGLPA